MTRRKVSDPIKLLDARRTLTEPEGRRLVAACVAVLKRYRSMVVKQGPPERLKRHARRAYDYLGGDPLQKGTPLYDYDHIRYGPFLGVSDEGSAAAAIRDAALESPKVRALAKSTVATPLVVGVAVDAERLGGVGEVAVGPEEYADIWLECVDRILITTNVGTRVNVRVYRREPRVLLRRVTSDALAKAKTEIAAAFRPFIETPDRRPRALTVFVDIPRFARITISRKRAALSRLARFVTSGKAAGRRRAPSGQALGLAAWVGRGLAGKASAMAAIDLASSAGLKVVVLDGVKRKVADEAISFAGLLDYFPPGIVGPLLRRAKEKGVQLRAANLPDTETIARSIWVALNTARNLGTNLGKYGCFPLTLNEIDRVVSHVQSWLSGWSAPVFYMDQGLLRQGAVDVERDLPRGIAAWLATVHARGARVVLIDTMDKPAGRRLLKTSSNDEVGYLTPSQVERIEAQARRLGTKVLWAGGISLADAFGLGKLGVFGLYVTSAAATTIAVSGSYVRDPALAGVKEPSKQAVLRTKVLVEAGFLVSRIDLSLGKEVDQAAQNLLAATGNASDTLRRMATLASLCRRAWPVYWKQMNLRARRTPR